jgi:hypothetical protein
MRTFLRCCGAAVALCLLALAAAQPPPRTIEERVAVLESGLATLETRFGLERTRPPDIGGESGLALAGRVTALERTLDRLATDVQRIERVADAAARDAAAAQRDAMEARQAARAR